ncbi:scavenger receptor cysteine-rich type 1 protein M130-like isoform X1 [Mya arenaria]|uniref:scavenger receptor cysteine-rich type 1 protein M130-like isoform X1 n=1 Tax=Mya arenaria TaxID=6604 RepID=UPI0022DFEC41|nr:scavenger receptor cysteine-rich type 1 protein M130-like isoform X1 [Mya arenaria]
MDLCIIHLFIFVLFVELLIVGCKGELYEVTSNSSEVQWSVKLVEGDTASAGGRVEILLGDQWTPICSQTTRVNAYIANVVCHQLGYAFGLSIFTQSRPPFQGSSVTGINCTGSEQRLEDCTGNRSLSRCYTRQLKVICSSEMTIRLNKNRLVLPNHAGRLEIFYDGHWNTACINPGNMHHLASVVCTQLRFDQGRLLPPWSIADTRVLDSYVRYHVRVSGVHCLGTEKSLGQCVELAGDTTSCDPREQVGIQCLAYTRLKLQGGGSFSGRVMVEHNGTWGSICDDNTGPGFANVVCKELGFAEGGFVTSTNHRRFGYFNGQIWLDEVNCSSNARSLSECSLNNGWGVHDCSHSEDVGVICREPGQSYESIWLDGGQSGRVRMNYVNVSGTVCPSGDPDNIARVICRELGYSFIDNEPYAFLMPSSFNAWLYNVSCDGTERNLHECRNSDIVHHTQTCSKELYVHCISSMSSSAETGAVRLTGGSSPKAGRLEVFYNHQWGSVCDDGVTNNLSRVVCSQLGYHT